MGAPDASSEAPEVVLRVTVRAADLDAFVTRYAPHVEADRIFIFAKSPQAVGARVRFTLQLSGGEPMIHGRGTVLRVQEETGDSRHPPGMELQFKALDERSQTLVEFMLAARTGPKTRTPSTPGVIEAATKAAGRPPSLLDAGWKLDPTPMRLPKVTPAPLGAGGKKPATSPGMPGTRPHSAWNPPSPAPSPLAGTKPLPSTPFSPAAPIPETGPATKPLPSAPYAPPAPLATTKPLPSSPFSPRSKATVSHPAASQPATTAEPALAPPPDAVEAPPPAAAPRARIPSLPGVGIPLDDDAAAAPVLAPMLPPPSARRRTLLLVGGGFAAGLLVGVVLMATLRRSPAPLVVAPEPAAPTAPMAATPPPSPSPPATSAPSPSGTAAAPSGASPAAAATAPSGTDTPSGAKSSATVADAPSPPAPSAAVARAPAPAAAPAASDGNAEVAVVSRPAGATVAIDGALAGRTPLVTRISPGRHELVLTKDRYAATATNITAPGRVRLDLRRPPATLRITSRPSGAEVVIAGESRGRTPLELKLPAYERYAVRITAPGSKPWSKTVYLGKLANRVDAHLGGAKKSSSPRSGRR